VSTANPAAVSPSQIVAKAIPLSLRERKKAKTRADLIEVSQRLFAERGYTETTLDAIAEGVDVTVQTLLRYFDSKADLALAPISTPTTELQQLLSDPARTDSALDIWRASLEMECEEVSNPTTALTANYVSNRRAFLHWGDKDPVLVAMSSDLSRRAQESLAAALAIDCDARPEDLQPTLLAAVLVTGRVAIWDRWLDEPNAESPIVDQLDLVDHGLERLAPEE